MTYKDLVDQLTRDLDTANQKIATLRRELADCSERLHAATKEGTQPFQASNQTLQQQIATLPQELQQELHRRLQQKITEKAEQANRTVANTLAKSEGLEKELAREKQEAQKVRNLLRGKEEQLRNLQILRGSDLATGPREAKLQQENTTLKGENARLKRTLERFERQLQAEKFDNVSQLPYMASSKDMDVDDEEPIPVVSNVRCPAVSHARPEISLPFRSNTVKSASFSMEGPTPTFRYSVSDEIAKNLKKTPFSKPALTASKIRKRKRSYTDQARDELDDLTIDMVEFPTMKRNKSLKVNVASSEAGIADFQFCAVERYGHDGGVKKYYVRSELKDFEVLQSRIYETTSIWVANCGEDWNHGLSGNSPSISTCITSKLAHKKTKWRKNMEGTFACQDCVKMGRPCFAPVLGAADDGWKYEEIHLLPLHELDRRESVDRGKAQPQLWINQNTPFQKSDVLNEYEDDEDYIDGKDG